MKLSRFSILVVVIAGMVSTGLASAAPADVSLNGITVSPAIEQLKVNPGDKSAAFNVQVTNHTSKTVSVQLSTNDFTALNNQGGVLFYGKDYNPATNPHGLAQWLKPQTPRLTLKPGQDQSLTVTIDDINALAKGGHYGALIYNVTPLGVSGKSGSQAQIGNNQVLSTLVFLSTNGQGTESLSLGQPLVSSFYLHMPSSLQFVLSNNGNTQTTPRGYVSLQSGSGKEISRGLINESSGLVLPGGQRLFDVDLSKEHNSIFGGHYHYKIAYRPDGSQQFSYYQKTFYVLGPFWIWLVIILVIAGLIDWRFKLHRRLKKIKMKKPKKITVKIVEK